MTEEVTNKREKLPEYADVQDLLARQSRSLWAEHAGGDGYHQNCAHTARGLAHLLLDHGETPQIYKISAPDEEHRLKPKVFDKLPDGTDVSWMWHAICVNRGRVYDPVFTSQYRLAEYLDQMFEPGYKIDVEYDTQDLIREFRDPYAA
jgi:hypothetical protein